VATLFTSQVPSAQTAEASPGPTLGTVIIPSVAGTIDQLGVYAPDILPSNATTAPFVLWDHTTSTELARVVRGSLTATAWNWATLTTPIAVSAGQRLVVSWRTSGPYGYIANFFQVSGLTNGLLSAPATGSDPIGNGRFATAADAYPGSTFGGHSYLTDFNFTAASSFVAPAPRVLSQAVNRSYTY
jgi:Domain of unknown function (DUF4082)